MLKFIRFMAGRNRPVIYGPLALSTAILGVQTASCFVVYFMLKAFLEHGAAAPVTPVVLLALLLLFLFGVYYALVLLYARRAMSGGYRIVAELRTRVCDHLRRLSLAFFRKHDPSAVSGTLLRNMSDAEAVFGMYIYEMAACLIVPLVLGLISFSWTGG